MRILLTQLFEPREPRTPLALMDLAAYGRTFGHSIVTRYDEGQPVEDEFDFVGVSAIVVDDAVVNQMYALRERYDGRIVLGGKGTLTMSDETRTYLSRLNVEMVSGPGELMLVPGRSIDYDTYPAWNYQDRHLLERTMHTKELMSSRGCPYHCHFCNNTEPKVKFFRPSRTVANAEMLLDMEGCNRLFFVDDIFSLSPDRMLDILATADQCGIDLRNRTQFFIHINQLSLDQMNAIDAFQPCEVQVGIESGSNEMLEAMGKQFTAEKAENRLRVMYDRGHRVACLFLMGFPGETRRSLQDTVDFVDRNRPYMSGVWVGYYQPVRGTKGWDMATERAGHEITTALNTDITYLDPNLTEEDLIQARAAIMDV